MAEKVRIALVLCPTSRGLHGLGFQGMLQIRRDVTVHYERSLWERCSGEGGFTGAVKFHETKKTSPKKVQQHATEVKTEIWFHNSKLVLLTVCQKTTTDLSITDTTACFPDQSWFKWG